MTNLFTGYFWVVFILQVRLSFHLGSLGSSNGIFTLTDWLSLGMECVNVHGEVESVLDGFHRVPVKFICFVDTLRVPIRPVEFILKQRQSERMWQP